MPGTRLSRTASRAVCMILLCMLPHESISSCIALYFQMGHTQTAFSLTLILESTLMAFPRAVTLLCAPVCLHNSIKALFLTCLCILSVIPILVIYSLSMYAFTVLFSETAASVGSSFVRVYDVTS